ncbi:MAG: hypothetical protein JXQ72_11925 [Anaerolineae bacterium]|nr:hypothetical protein [Anaerolineae bacterium]
MLKRGLLIVLLVALTAVPVVLAQDAPPEVVVREITLTGPAAAPRAEISGLDWYGDWLLLLAENPNIYATDNYAGMFYALPKADILAYLDSDDPAPLEPVAVPVIAPDIAATVPGFDGFEAVAFAGDDQVFLMIEAIGNDGSMRGYLVPGTVGADLESITLDLDAMVEILPQSDTFNMSYESLLILDDTVVTLYEINGAGINATAQALVFGLDLTPQDSLPLAHLDYRLTDVTAVDEDGIFWATNYFYPGEDFLLPEVDPLVEMYGEGATHTEYPHVERLVKFQVTEDGIVLADAPPIWLELPGEDARNWEGIARLDDRGFLLVTDKYPQTILGFVATEE